MVIDSGIKMTSVSWIHGYMKGIFVDFISKIYPFISTIPLTT